MHLSTFKFLTQFSVDQLWIPLVYNLKSVYQIDFLRRSAVSLVARRPSIGKRALSVACRLESWDFWPHFWGKVTPRQSSYLRMIIKGGKKRPARSSGVVRRHFSSVEIFWARKTPETRAERVGIFKYQYAVQSIFLYEFLEGSILEALIPSLLFST